MSLADGIRLSMEHGSWIRKMFEEGDRLKAQHGADKVFDLSLGNPVLEPPAGFDAELKRQLGAGSGRHRYMPNAGYAETREAVAAQLAADFELPFTMQQVVMTCGAAGAMNVALKTILNPGDEVILLAPYFVEYANYADNHGGVVRVVPPGAGFLPDIAQLEAAIGARTRAVIINSPNNPTGVVYPDSVLAELGALLRRKEAELGREIYLLSDEPYRKIIYDGLAYPTPLHHYQRTVIAYSHSKDLGLAGERIGYLAVHPRCPDAGELVNGFIYCNRILGFVNAPALMQRLVSRLQAVSVDITDYQQKRDLVYDKLLAFGYRVVKPQGAFYFFPAAPGGDDVAFVRALQRQLVLAVPGRGFGAPGYFRIAYCVDDATLQGALAGLEKAAADFRTE